MIPIKTGNVTTPDVLPALKKHLGMDVDNTIDDEVLSIFIDSAIDTAENICNRSFRKDTYSYRVAAVGSIELKPSPLISVESISDHTVEQYIVTTDEVVGYVSPVEDWLTPQIEISYTVGYNELPKPVLNWILLRCASMYTNPADIITGTQMHQLPKSHVDGLLDPYRIWDDL